MMHADTAPSETGFWFLLVPLLVAGAEALAVRAVGVGVAWGLWAGYDAIAKALSDSGQEDEAQAPLTQWRKGVLLGRASGLLARAETTADAAGKWQRRGIATALTEYIHAAPTYAEALGAVVAAEARFDELDAPGRTTTPSFYDRAAGAVTPEPTPPQAFPWALAGALALAAVVVLR